jgi:hypothetical protein
MKAPIGGQMTITSITDIAGDYKTTLAQYGDSLSPLIVNDDGSVNIAGTIVSAATFSGAGFVFGPFSVNGVNFPGGQISFAPTGGTMKFSGVLMMAGSAQPLPYGGEEVVAFSSPSLQNSVDAFGAFDNGDAIYVIASNGQWVGDGGGFLQTYPTQPGFLYSVETTDSGIKINYDGYQYWAGQLGQRLQSHATADQATVFNVRATLDGSAILMAQNGGYVTLAPDGSLMLENESVLSLPMEFKIQVFPVAHDILLARWGIVAAKVEISDCATDVLNLCWQCTGGIILALGMGPYILTGTMKPGLLQGLKAILQKNDAVWRVVQAGIQTLMTNLNPGIAWSVVVGILAAAWHAGLFWKLVKYVLRQAGWGLLFWMVAKLIELIFLPEVEVVELLASIVVWTARLSEIIGLMRKDCPTSPNGQLLLA